MGDLGTNPHGLLCIGSATFSMDARPAWVALPPGKRERQGQTCYLRRGPAEVTVVAGVRERKVEVPTSNAQHD